ncbi:hypothetical protein AMECASPLE_036813 [Ameca splendens]|uniref:Uncharacterized protein n=1 Tax=Ameca splendens TaxID=208324 RepID=A0ABV0XWP6_9TELE
MLLEDILSNFSTSANFSYFSPYMCYQHLLLPLALSFLYVFPVHKTYIQVDVFDQDEASKGASATINFVYLFLNIENTTGPVICVSLSSQTPSQAQQVATHTKPGSA